MTPAPENQVPATQLYHRIESLQKRMQTGGPDAALILQNTDLYYFSGTIQQSYLYIPMEGEPLLLVRKDPERAAAESALKQVIPVSSPRQIIEWVQSKGYPSPRSLGLELDVLPAASYLGFQRMFPDCALKDVSHTIRELRAVKSPYEIDKIRKAAAGSDQMAAFVRNHLVEGIPEIHLAGLVEAEARRLGHQGIVRMRMWNNELFFGHLMAGPSAAVPSYLASPTGGDGVGAMVAQGASLRPIGRHEPVLFDYVFVYGGYIADQTRIFSIGALPDQLMRGHEAMLIIERLLKSAVRPGMNGGDVYDMAFEAAEASGFGEVFMGSGDRKLSFVGHGVGLELDEYPVLARGQKMTLTENMVIAIEPKLIFPGVGVVGIENTHRVTREGLETFGSFETSVVTV